MKRCKKDWLAILLCLTAAFGVVGLGGCDDEKTPSESSSESVESSLQQTVTQKTPLHSLRFLLRTEWRDTPTSSSG